MSWSWSWIRKMSWSSDSRMNWTSIGLCSDLPPPSRSRPSSRAWSCSQTSTAASARPSQPSPLPVTSATSAMSRCRFTPRVNSNVSFFFQPSCLCVVGSKFRSLAARTVCFGLRFHQEGQGSSWILTYWEIAVYTIFKHQKSSPWCWTTRSSWPRVSRWSQSKVKQIEPFCHKCVGNIALSTS